MIEKVDNLNNDKLYAEIADIIRIANKAVKEAKEDNKRLGIPDTFVKGGKVYYELISGEITTERPEIMR